MYALKVEWNFFVRVWYVMDENWRWCLSIVCRINKLTNRRLVSIGHAIKLHSPFIGSIIVCYKLITRLLGKHLLITHVNAYNLNAWWCILLYSPPPPQQVECCCLCLYPCLSFSSTPPPPDEDSSFQLDVDVVIKLFFYKPDTYSFSELKVEV